MTTVGKSKNAEGAQGGNVYAQLEQKEKDLLLAAELGKALLEQNKQLQAKQDQMQSQFSQTIEVLQQERHALERKLAAVEGEHESHMEELCSEIDRLQEGLARQHIKGKMSVQEKEQYIDELIQHNQRIGQDLRRTTEEKEELVAHIGSLENQVRAGMSGDQVEPALVEEFEKQVRELEQRREELMGALKELTSERENMEYNLEDANRRILMLERNVRELEQQVFIQEVQLEELRRTHCTTLHDLEELRLSEALAHIYTSTAAQGTSLYEELDQATSSSYTEADTHMMEDSENEKQLKEKCQKLQGAMNTIQQHITLLTHKLRQWKSGDFDPNAPSTSGINANSLVPFEEEDITPNAIIERMGELQELIEDIMSEQHNQPPPPSPRPEETAQLQSHISTLRQELDTTQTTVDDLQLEVIRQNQALKERDERIKVLSVKLDYRRSMPDPNTLFKRYMDSQDTSSLAILQELTNSQASSSTNATSDNASILSDDSLDSAACMQHEEEIEKLRKERDEALNRILSDDSLDSAACMQHEDEIEKLTKERDKALNRRAVAEHDLSEARAALDDLDGQMMGAVHQKLEICKQTDNWEVDLHEMLDERLRKKIRKHEGGGGGKKSKKNLGKSPRKRIGHLK